MSGALHILQHALGLDQYGRGAFYRNHFVTGPDSVDHADCTALVERGFMVRHARNAITGDMDVFAVTDAGRIHVMKESPAPPKQTRGQKRYDAFLRADCGMSFGEWLKREAA